MSYTPRRYDSGDITPDTPPDMQAPNGQEQRASLVQAAEGDMIPAVFFQVKLSNGQYDSGLLLPSGRRVRDINVAVRGILQRGKHAKAQIDAGAPDLPPHEDGKPRPTWEEIVEQERKDLEFIRTWWIKEGRPQKPRAAWSAQEEHRSALRARGVEVVIPQAESALLRKVRQDTRPEDRKKGKPAGHN